MNISVFPALLIARRWRWLEEIDPLIAAVIVLIFAGICLVYSIHCFHAFYTMARDDDDEKYSAFGYGVGNFIAALIFGAVSLYFFGETQNDNKSIAYGMFRGSGNRPGSADQFTESDQLRLDSSPWADRNVDDPSQVRRPDHAREFERAKSAADAAMERHKSVMERHKAEMNRRLDESAVRRPARVDDSSSSLERRPPRLDSSASNSEAVLASLPERPATALPFFQYALNQAQKSKYVGGRTGRDFTAHGPAGSVLVGLKLGFEDTAITGMQPIYQLEDRYISGEILGDMGDNSQLLLARPGYVVGGALVSSNAQSLSLQLRFLRYDSGTGGLDVFDQYDSARAGRMAGAITELDGDGAMVVGLFGQFDSNRLSGFGVAGLKPTSGALPVSTNADPRRPASSPSPEAAFTNDYRVWYSTDRSFSVEAKLLQFKNGKAVLEKRDGSVVEVDPAQLCREDNEYLNTR